MKAGTILVGGSKSEFQQFQSGMKNVPNGEGKILRGFNFQHVPKLEKLGETSERLFASSAGIVLLSKSNGLLALSAIVDKQYDRPPTLGKPIIVDGPSHSIAKVDDAFRTKGFITQGKLFDVAQGDGLFVKLANGLNGAGRKDYTPSVSKITDEHRHVAHAINKRSEGKDIPPYNVTVFCSAHTKNEKFLKHAGEAGKMIAANNWGLVYGGGNASMMGAVSENAHKHGARVIGVSIPVFVEGDIMPSNGDKYMDELVLAEDIYTRMYLMDDVGDALLVLNGGGLGTAQEAFAVIEKKKDNLNNGNKPVILINENGFWDDIDQMLAADGHSKHQDYHIAQNLDEAEAILLADADRKQRESRPQIVIATPNDMLRETALVKIRG